MKPLILLKKGSFDDILVYFYTFTHAHYENENRNKSVYKYCHDLSLAFLCRIL